MNKNLGLGGRKGSLRRWYLLLLAFFAGLPVVLWAQEERNIQSDGKEWEDAGKKFDARVVLKGLKSGYTFKNIMVPMRDGVGLATTVFIPPGEGPWGVILVRTPYERSAGSKYFKRLTEKTDYVCIIQDPRGDGDSQGALKDPLDAENEIWDGYDTVDWIARQPWCNGRIGMTGSSGNGFCAVMAYFSKHPNLVAVNPGNSAGNIYLYKTFENGVRRMLYDWFLHRNLKVKEWPKPTLYSYDLERWNALEEEASRGNQTVYIGDDGWFNHCGDSALELFQKFAAKGRVFVKVTARTHGGDAGIKFPFRSKGVFNTANFLDVLDGKEPPEKSQIFYEVMGDADDPSAPGNLRVVADKWPPESRPVSFYFTANGGLSKDAPTVADGAVSYRYDPKNPAPTIGGVITTSPTTLGGARDQAPLKERKDVVRFVSEPLAEPLAVAGKLKADLAISSDVPDTVFIVKFIDIYPDGKEIILREAAAMARYRDGLQKQAGPMEKGKVYKLEFLCNSTAIVFNKGHRIGIFVTSSSTPAYEVHPNTYEQVASYDNSPVANLSIHCSKEAASRVILPVVDGF